MVVVGLEATMVDIFLSPDVFFALPVSSFFFFWLGGLQGKLMSRYRIHYNASRKRSHRSCFPTERKTVNKIIQV